MADIDISENLALVKERVQKACLKRAPELQQFQPRLVAVSKTHPKELILEAYKCGQRHFGENYVQELSSKGHDDIIRTDCPDIKWHMIGHLQSNKVGKVLAVPNLYIVETVDTAKLATTLNNHWQNKPEKDLEKLNIFIQVNTSGEEEKSGCKPGEATALVQFVREKCPYLNVKGLMTIGQYDNYNAAEGLNPDFQTLLKCRLKVCEDLDLKVNDLEVSMGMSADFEHAIEVGSNNVRVGTAIFGQRNYTAYRAAEAKEKQEKEESKTESTLQQV